MYLVSFEHLDASGAPEWDMRLVVNVNSFEGACQELQRIFDCTGEFENMTVTCNNVAN